MSDKFKFTPVTFLTIKEIGSIVSYGAKHGEPSVALDHQLTALMKFDVLGLALTIEQHFNTNPCVFVFGTDKWRIAFNAERNQNAPARPMAPPAYGSNIMAHIFGDNAPNTVYMFGASWTVTMSAILISGTEDDAKHDIAVLKMVDDLWA